MSIYFESVCKSFDNVEILKNFSLELPNNGCVCFFGKSGIGKTTLLDLIANIKFPDSGRIEKEPLTKISYVFQEDRLIPSINALENVYLVIEKDKFHNAEFWLDVVNFDGNCKFPVQYLSGGLKRKVSIARALAYESNVLLLDEPFNSIDQESTEKIMKFLTNFKKENLIVLVTHNVEEAKFLADKIYYFQGLPLKLSV